MKTATMACWTTGETVTRHRILETLTFRYTSQFDEFACIEAWRVDV